MNLIIRQETIMDHAEVFGVVQKAFETEPFSDHQEQFLVERLRKSDSFVPELSLVADLDGQIVAYLLLSKIQIKSDHDYHEALALAPVAVLPAYQRKGIGAQLIHRAHEIARDMGFSGIVLLGHADYYPRFGYFSSKTFGIKLPFNVPDENCLAKELYPGAFDSISGTVEYPKAFFE